VSANKPFLFSFCSNAFFHVKSTAVTVGIETSTEGNADLIGLDLKPSCYTQNLTLAHIDVKPGRQTIIAWELREDSEQQYHIITYRRPIIVV